MSKNWKDYINAGVDSAKKLASEQSKKAGIAIVKGAANTALNQGKKLKAKVQESLDEKDLGTLTQSELYAGVVGRWAVKMFEGTVKTGIAVKDQGEKFFKGFEQSMALAQVIPNYKAIRTIIDSELAKEVTSEKSYSMGNLECQIQRTRKSNSITIHTYSKRDEQDNVIVQTKEKVSELKKVGTTLLQKVRGTYLEPTTGEGQTQQAINRDFIDKSGYIIEKILDIGAVDIDETEAYKKEDFVSDLKETLNDINHFGEVLSTFEVSNALENYKASLVGIIDTHVSAIGHSQEEELSKDEKSNYANNANLVSGQILTMYDKLANTYTELIKQVPSMAEEFVETENIPLLETVDQTIQVTYSPKSKVKPENLDTLFTEIKNTALTVRDNLTAKKTGVEVILNFEGEEAVYKMNLQKGENTLNIELQPSSKLNPYVSLDQEFELNDMQQKEEL